MSSLQEYAMPSKRKALGGPAREGFSRAEAIEEFLSYTRVRDVSLFVWQVLDWPESSYYKFRALPLEKAEANLHRVQTAMRNYKESVCSGK